MPVLRYASTRDQVLSNKGLNILFVSSWHHPEELHLHASTRYRCYNQAEALSKLGHIADVTSQMTLSTRILERYHAVIFLKPRYSRTLTKALRHLHNTSILAIADYDDLVFDERYVAESCLVRSGSGRPRRAMRQYLSHKRAFELFDYFTVSTAPLAEELLTCQPDANVAVIPNGLSRRWLDGYKLLPEAKPSHRIITYLPGNPHHAHDFALIERILGDYLRANSTVRLRIAGNLSFNMENIPSAQLERLPHQPYNELPRLIKESWVTLAPLEDNRFNRCKSAIKFYESSALGTPVIATPIPDMRRHRCLGLRFATSPREWNDALYDLETTTNAGVLENTMHTYVRQHCTVDTFVPGLIDQIQRWAGMKPIGIETGASISPSATLDSASPQSPVKTQTQPTRDQCVEAGLPANSDAAAMSQNRRQAHSYGKDRRPFRRLAKDPLSPRERVRVREERQAQIAKTPLAHNRTARHDPKTATSLVPPNNDDYFRFRPLPANRFGFVYRTKDPVILVLVVAKTAHRPPEDIETIDTLVEILARELCFPSAGRTEDIDHGRPPKGAMILWPSSARERRKSRALAGRLRERYRGLRVHIPHLPAREWIHPLSLAEKSATAVLLLDDTLIRFADSRSGSGHSGVEDLPLPTAYVLERSMWRTFRKTVKLIKEPRRYLKDSRLATWICERNKPVL